MAIIQCSHCVISLAGVHSNKINFRHSCSQYGCISVFTLRNKTGRRSFLVKSTLLCEKNVMTVPLKLAQHTSFVWIIKRTALKTELDGTQCFILPILIKTFLVLTNCCRFALRQHKLNETAINSHTDDRFSLSAPICGQHQGCRFPSKSFQGTKRLSIPSSSDWMNL